MGWTTLGKELRKDAQVARRALRGCRRKKLPRFQRERLILIEDIELGSAVLPVTLALGADTYKTSCPPFPENKKVKSM